MTIFLDIFFFPTEQKKRCPIKYEKGTSLLETERNGLFQFIAFGLIQITSLHHIDFNFFCFVLISKFKAV